MIENNGDYARNDKGYRIRCMKSLAHQIKEDHAHLNGLCEKLQKEKTDSFLIEELQRILSWLNQEVESFKEMRKIGIEGISLGEINEIDRDIKDKERHLKLFLYSTSMELENIHRTRSIFRQ